jgi:hypothetical protein
MATTTTARKKQLTTAKPDSRANEVIAVIFLALAMLVFLSVVTYSPDDTSYNGTGFSPNKRQNWIGWFGAVFADLMFQYIGLVIYIVPVLLALIAWRIFQSKKLHLSLGQLFGYALFVVSAAGLFRLFGFSGGIIGKFFAETILIALIGKIGTGIVLATFCLTSLLIITKLSLITFFGSFGMAFENFGIHFNEWLTKRRARSDER